jgi:hypothetical protein
LLRDIPKTLDLGEGGAVFGFGADGLQFHDGS